MVKERIEVFTLTELNFSTRNGNARGRIQDNRWEPQPTGWVKCNFDCSLRDKNIEIGVGWIIRDNGKHVISGCSKLPAVKSVSTCHSNIMDTRMEIHLVRRR